MDDRFSTGDFDWDDARMFLAAYRSGSLLAASRALEVSHSTVRRRLAGLEAALGAPLFTATSDGLVPTDAAEAAFPLAERLEAAADAFRGRLTGEGRALRGSLIITTVDALAERLAPALARYADAHPKVAVTVNTERRALDLARREADVALRHGDEPDERLFGRCVGRLDYAPFAAQSLIDRFGAEMAHLPWILWDKTAKAVGAEAWYAERSGGEAPILRVTDASALIAFARAGLGGALLPVPIARRAGLVQIGETIERFTTKLWCLCHHDLRHSERVRRFMDLLADETLDFV